MKATEQQNVVDLKLKKKLNGININIFIEVQPDFT